MKNSHSTILMSIHGIISRHFNSMLKDFLGIAPSFKDKKNLVISSTGGGLVDIFFKALNTKEPSKEEEETLKTLLVIANDYFQALENKTKAKTLFEVNSYLKDTENKEKSFKISEIKNIVNEELDTAKKHFGLIVNAETNKAKNFATAMQISKVAESQDIEDPNVFFVVVRDERNDPETLRLHLMEDGITPRVWKLSQLNTGYHDRKGVVPSLSGTGPWCRCHLSFIPPGFSFNQQGKIQWKSPDWNEYKNQKENHSAPPSHEQFYGKSKK